MRKEKDELQMGVEQLLQISFAYGTDFLRDHFAALENQQRRNAADVIPHRSPAIFVDVQLADLHLAVILVSYRVDRRTHHPARTAPFRPKIHQHRYFGAEDVALPSAVVEG